MLGRCNNKSEQFRIFGRSLKANASVLLLMEVMVVVVALGETALHNKQQGMAKQSNSWAGRLTQHW
jgi:hypothetical protein